LKIDFNECVEPTTRSVEVIVHVDEFGDPSGIELIGVQTALGQRAAEQFEELARHTEVRLSYDRDADAATIGTGIAMGSRIAKSATELATARLDSTGRLVSLEVPVHR